MHDVFKGIVVGILGFLVWFGVSVVGGLMEGIGGGRDPLLYGLMFVGFFLMVGGPVVYIGVLPAVAWLRRRRAREG